MTDNQLNYPKNIQIKGSDAQGTTVYKDINDLWEKELVKDQNNELKWYTSGADYWRSVEPTVDGMLGGLSYVSDSDIDCSRKFIDSLGTQLVRGKALDCGAGIGRVTQNLLLSVFDKVDLLEQNALFLDQAKVIFKDEKRVEHYFPLGLQDFKFKDHNGIDLKYDCIWIQWVIGQLTDVDLIDFIKRCLDALNENGILVIKDNVAKKSFIMDREDNSVARTDEHIRYLFSQANATIVKTILQPNFPKDLIPVRLYSLVKSKPQQSN